MRRSLVLLLALVLLAAPALAAHEQGKGARSLGGKTVPRTEEWLRIETDDFPTKPLGALETDAGATEGKAWNISSYGSITTEIDVPETGVLWVDIRARGWHPPDMMNTHMHILIDGEQRAEWDVRGEWATYPQSVPILKGKHTISIENFDNYRGAKLDRTLVVDWVSFSQPTLEGTPRVPAGGHVVVDAADIHNSVTGQLERSTLARNDTMWLQWGVGCFVEMFVAEGSGEHQVDARLKGNVHDGVGTRVQVRLDSEELAEYFVGEAWEQKVTRFTASAGPHMLEICYDNDEPGKKRNLWLDEMVFTSFAAAGTGGTPPTPPPADVPGAPWLSAHAGLDNHRYAESVVDAESVRTARQAWTYRVGAVTGTPAYDDGVLYFADFLGKAHAVRAKDGSVVWTADLPAGVDSSAALDEQNVYFGDMDGSLTALRRSDGSRVWSVKADPVEGTHLYGSPVVHEGVLYTGVASEQTLIEYEGPQTFRGSVAAFDTRDGRQVWKTYTQTEAGKGVSVWSTPAIDPELGLLYVGTGNSYGEPVSQYTDSIVALKMADGAVAWHFQATKNDAFNARGAPGPDRDFGASPLLFEAGGRRLVGDGDKGGVFFALDRATGALVWQAKADFKVEGVAASQVEGFLGTASYRDGVIYAPTTARSMVTAIKADTGEILWDTELNPLPQKYGDRMFAPSTAADGVVLQGNAFGRVFALDMATGEILANLSAGGAVQGGITLAGNLFVVPDVGKDLWSGKGGLTAYRVTPGAAPVVTSPGPTTTTPTAGPTPEPQALTVRLLGGFFEPKALTIRSGDTVTFVNEDSLPHTVTSTWDDGTTFDVALKPGETYAHTFDTAGTWAIHCRPHAQAATEGAPLTGMVMTVEVTAAGAGAVNESIIPGAPLGPLLVVLAALALFARARRQA